MLARFSSLLSTQYLQTHCCGVPQAYFLGPKSWLANHPDTWANANYSANMPWTWSRYQARSTVRPGAVGHNITIKMWGTDRPVGILNQTSPEMD